VGLIQNVVLRKGGEDVGVLQWQELGEPGYWTGDVLKVSYPDREVRKRLANLLAHRERGVTLVQFGGMSPDVPGRYFECVMQVLEHLKSEFPEFDYGWHGTLEFPYEEGQVL
jgi:hypothetical protein